MTFEELCHLAGADHIDILVGRGYARIFFAGLEVIVWLVDPGEITDMEQDEREELC